MSSFSSFGLDDRLQLAVAEVGWSEPTLIQQHAIPLILEGKDVLARGRTGSGKTGAFALPVLQSVLSHKKLDVGRLQCISGLFLAPSRELCKQITLNVLQLTKFCARSIRCVDVSEPVALESQRPMLSDLPDVVVGTPSRILAHMKSGNLDVSESLRVLVVDEADLVFSFGHEKDIKGILARLPSVHQTVLTSATLSDSVLQLKRLLLHNPVVLKLEEPQLASCDQLTQYRINLNEEEDKFVLIYALFKLSLIQGRSIIFVKNVDRCYQLKLYLEQFQIPVALLNAELPAASRCHAVQQFNDGVYDVIVASDEKFVDDPNSSRKKDKESGVARGIDFQFVSNVINFDFPPDVDSYIHRVGRTARGNNKGTALSLIVGSEMDKVKEVEKTLIAQTGEESIFKPYHFKMEELSGFRYRTKDAWRAVTRIAVREARLKEIKKEMLNAQSLRSHFQENPRDEQLLRHDNALHIVKHQPHLKNVPEYIVPPTLRKIRKSGNSIKKRSEGNAGANRNASAKRKFEKNNADPLKKLAGKRRF